MLLLLPELEHVTALLGRPLPNVLDDDDLARVQLPRHLTVEVHWPSRKDQWNVVVTYNVASAPSFVVGMSSLRLKPTYRSPPPATNID
ncbi:hypothetical protein AURDEDRAFT_167384 [Auricularia subglabra TFB-10046 SS5]|nr:hypothetical protein AURDEDRAFT_167384 [Auricularia subglabra TFB-10046 SS5]